MLLAELGRQAGGGDGAELLRDLHLGPMKQDGAQGLDEQLVSQET